MTEDDFEKEEEKGPEIEPLAWGYMFNNYVSIPLVKSYELEDFRKYYSEGSEHKDREFVVTRVAIWFDLKHVQLD